MPAPPRMPPAQQELYARIPTDWAPMPTPNLVPAGPYVALNARGLIETRADTANNRWEWRRTPDGDA